MAAKFNRLSHVRPLNGDNFGASDRWQSLSDTHHVAARFRPEQPGSSPATESVLAPPVHMPFTAGNIVVYRVGTGSGALSNIATAVFLDEYTTAGAFVQSIAMPILDSGANQILSASGSATSEGLLTLSANGQYLILTGYDSAPGTAGNVVSTSTATVVRVIGRVDASGAVDTSTTTTAFSGNNIRGAASNDGTTFWATGSNSGVVYASLSGSGAGTAVSSGSTVVNLRAVEIFGGQLYVSTSSGSSFRIGAVGSGLPATAGQNITNIPGGPVAGGPYQFFFADLTAGVPGLDTLYVADDTAGQLQKFTYNGTAWDPDGSIALASARGLTASVSGSNVTLYATTGSAIFVFTDTSGYDGTIAGTATSLVTAGTNTAFRGIAFAPTAVAAETQTVQFNPVSVTHDEGDSGTTAYTFTVTRTGGTAGQLNFSGTIAAGDTDNADYVGGTAPTTFSGSILAGQTSATVTVNIQGDYTIENLEAFFLTLTTATNTVGTVTVNIGANDDATGLITNDDVAGGVAVGDVSIVEGDSGQTFLTVTLTRSFGNADFSVDYATGVAGNATLHATDGQDYQGAISTANFTGGATTVTFQLAIFGDTLLEGNEQFAVFLSNATNGAIIGDDEGIMTIIDNEVPVAGQLSIGDVTLAEGNSGTTAFTFTVLRTGGDDGAVSATWTLDAPGGAGLADSADFPGAQPTSGTVSFADGETSQTITILVQGDVAVETTETFLVTLSAPMGGATLGNANGTGTINNDDAPPPPGSVSIADVSIVEGNAGTSLLVFTLTRTGGTSAFAVNYATANGGNPNNASATAGSDYVAGSGTVSFADGQTTATFSITINGDTLAELSEEFTVTLSGATNGATISDATAIGTITTDDALSAAPANPWLNEFHYDNAGADAGEFIEVAGAAGVSLTGWSLVLYNGSPTQLNNYATIALSGTFANQSGGFGTLQFAAVGLQNGGAGASAEPDGIALVNNLGQVVEFISYEGTFTPTAGPAAGMTSTDVGVGIFEPGDATGTSIARTSGPPGATWVVAGTATPGAVNTGQTLPTGGTAVPGIAVSDVLVNEAAGTMTFIVTRTNVAAGAFNVSYETANGSASAGSDFVATSGVLSFTDNQVQAQVTVTINDNGTPELDETLFLNLLNPTGGATIVDAQGVGTIVNDDGAPIQISINDVSIAEGNAGTSLLTFTVTRSGGTGAFDVNFQSQNDSASSGSDYVATSGTLHFAAGDNSETISVTINGDTIPESNETFLMLLSGATNDAVIVDGSGTGTIVNDESTFIHDIQGTAYFSPILAGDGISGFNTASTTVVTVRAIVTAVDNVGPRQGYYLAEEITDWDGNSFTSEGIFVMTRNDAGVGTVVSGVSVGDLVQLSANVMEYQAFSTMPRTMLVNSTGLLVISAGNVLPTVTLTNMPNAVMTLAAPDYTDSSDGVGDTFDASVYALSYFETVEGMLVTIPNMVVADGFVSTSGGDPYLMAYSLDSANAGQINSRGGYTISGDPPIGPPDTGTTGDDTHNGGQVLHDGDVNPDIIEIDFTDFAMSPPSGLTTLASMGDLLGDVTGIIDFDFTDRKLFVTAMEPGGFVDGGSPTQETTALGNDGRSLTVATFNVENLDPGDGAARFTALANAIANNLSAPDIICIEEMQDNNGAAAGDGTSATGTNAATTWQMLVDALNLATGAHYQWVDELPVYNAEGGEQSGNIRVGFLYNTDRVQLGDLDANATITERRMYTDRIGDGVRDPGDLIAYSDNMLGGEINTADWTTTRKSLLGEFTFNGNTVYITANHWPSKGGSGEFWQFDQAGGDPANSDWAQRSQVGQDVYSMLNLIQSGNPNAGIVAGGDFNDFYFYRPLTTVTGYTMADGTARVGGARFDNLTLTLPEAERYTYTFDGRSQAIDHIIANGLLSAVATYDVVHLNTGFNPSSNAPLSDHDPGLSSYDYRNFSEVLLGTSGADVIFGFGGDDDISGLGGNDVLRGDAGHDTLAGGFGDDFLYVDADDLVVEALGEGYDNVAASVSYTLTAGAYVEVLSTTDNDGLAAINLIGNERDNILVGNAASNYLDGGTGADRLAGRGGDDFLIVDTGDVVEELAGGGYDNVGARSHYVLTFGAHVEVLSTTDNDGLVAINLIGNELANILVGNAASNYLDGGTGGIDRLAGRGGDDALIVDTGDVVEELAGGGYDNVAARSHYVLTFGAHVEVLSTTDNGGTTAINLTGNEFANILVGNAGDNILDGSFGHDRLDGLGGEDGYAFTTFLSSFNIDTIIAFEGGDGGDRILLDDAIFTGLALGALDPDAFHVGAATQDAEDRIIYDPITGQLYFDPDGTGGVLQIQFAVLAGAIPPALTSADFTVI